jgi:hypothetical protein
MHSDVDVQIVQPPYADASGLNVSALTTTPRIEPRQAI